MHLKKIGTIRLSWQYFLSYLLVMLTVMGMLLIYVYNSFYEFHSQLLLVEYQSRLELLRETHESELNSLLIINNQIGTSSEAKPFTFEDEPARGAVLIKRIATLKAANQFIHGIYLRYYGENYIFSNLSSHTVQNFSGGAVVHENVSPEKLMYHWENTSRMTILPAQTVEGYGFGVYNDKQQFVTVFLPLTYSNIWRCGTVMYLVKQSIYQSWFDSIINDTADVYLMGGDECLVGRQRSALPVETLLAAADEHGKLPSVITCEGEKYHLLSLQGDQFAYWYMMLIPDEELQVAMSSSVRLLMLVASLIAALGALIIMRTVQSRMKPIKLLYDMLSDRVPTGNELVEIRDGVQRLIDENNAMSSRMESMETLQRSDFAQRFLTGSFASVDEFLMLAENIHINVDVPCFAVAILAKPDDGNYSLQPEKLNMLFTGEVDGVTRMMPLNDRAVMILFAQDETTLFSFLDQKLEGMRAICMGMTMAVSNVHSDYRDGQRAYLEAENAFDLRFVKGNTQVIRFSNLKENFEQLPEYNHQLVENLRLALHGGHPELIHAALQDISTSMREMNTSLFMFRCMYNDILNVISTEACKSGSNVRETYNLFKLSQCLSLADLDSMLRGVCTSLIAERMAVGSAPVSPVQQAKAILDQRYWEMDISVSEVAAQVGLSDSKLSSSFKAEYAMTPIEYMTSLRMHRARKLLRTTRMSVKDIAIECGYYDISGFNRRFKSYTSMTPQQYRQSHTAEAASGGIEP